MRHLATFEKDPAHGEQCKPALGAKSRDFYFHEVNAVKLIPLTRDYIAVVDDADYERVIAAGPWFANPKPNVLCYAERTTRKNGKKVTEKMHRFILGVTDPKIQVDHKNRYGMDNRRCNLRLCTRSQNIANSRKTSARKTSSSFRGVSWHKSNEKWASRLQINGKLIHLGYFADERAAANAYDDAARKHFGDFAHCNFLTKR